jgi:hypothetical protein
MMFNQQTESEMNEPERNSRTRGKTISDVRVEFGSAARDHFIAQTAS